MGRVFLAAVFLSLAVPSGRADVVRLKNGSSFRGRIVKETPREVVIRTEYGRISFSRDQISKVIRDRSGPVVSHREKKGSPFPLEERVPGKDSAGGAGAGSKTPKAGRGLFRSGRGRPGRVPEKNWKSPYVHRGRRHPETLKLLERLSRSDWNALLDFKPLGARGAPAIPRLLRYLGWKKTVLVEYRDSLTLYSVNHGPFLNPTEEQFLPRISAVILSDMGAVSLRPLLLVLDDENPLRRYWAVSALAWNRAAKLRRDIHARVAALLNDPDVAVRGQAIEALGFWRATAYKGRIFGFLLDPDSGIRGNSIDALKRMVQGPELDPTPLLRALHSRMEWKVRAARGVLRRLKGRFRDAHKVAAALELEEGVRGPSRLSPREKVRRLRKSARKGGDAAFRAALAGLRDSSPLVRSVAVGILSKIEDPRRKGILTKALGDPARSVRRAAGYALGRVGGMEALPILFRAYADGRIGESALALVRRLNRKDPGRVGAALAGRLRGGSAGERRAAALLLGLVSDPKSKGILVRTARWDRDSKVRKAALEALVRLGKSASLPSLVRALRDKDSEIKEFALRRLRSITKKKMGPDPRPWESWLRSR